MKKKKLPWILGACAAVFVGMMALGAAQDGKEPAPTPEPVRSVATAAPTAVPTPTPYRIHGMDPQRTVYVSNSGVIHIENDCSGMKHYTEMTVEEADAAGYEYCSKCVW